MLKTESLYGQLSPDGRRYTFSCQSRAPTEAAAARDRDRRQ